MKRRVHYLPLSAKKRHDQNDHGRCWCKPYQGDYTMADGETVIAVYHRSAIVTA